MDPSGVMPRRAFTIRTEAGIHRRISQQEVKVLVRSRIQQARSLAGRRKGASAGVRQSELDTQRHHFFPKEAFPSIQREDADATERAWTPSPCENPRKAFSLIAKNESEVNSNEKAPVAEPIREVVRAESCYDQSPAFEQKFSWSSVEDGRDDQESSFLRDGLRSMPTSDDSLEQNLLEIKTMSDDEGWENQGFGGRSPRLSPTNTTRPLPESPVYRNKVLVADNIANTTRGSSLVQAPVPISSPSPSKKEGKSGSLLRVSRTRIKDQSKTQNVLKETQGSCDKNRMVQETSVSVSTENVDRVVQETVRKAREAAKDELTELLKESAEHDTRDCVQTSVIAQSNTERELPPTEEKMALAPLEVRTAILPHTSEQSEGLQIATEPLSSPKRLSRAKSKSSVETQLKDGAPNADTFNEKTKIVESTKKEIMEADYMGTPQSPLMISESLEDRVQRGQSPLWSFVKNRTSRPTFAPQHSDHFFPENKFREAEWPYFEHNGKQKEIMAAPPSDAFPLVDSFASNITSTKVQALSEETKGPDKVLPWTNVHNSLRQDNVKLVDGFPVEDATEDNHDDTIDEEFSDFQWPQWPNVQPPSTDPFDVWGDSSDQWPQRSSRGESTKSSTQRKDPLDKPDTRDQTICCKPGEEATGRTDKMVSEADQEHLHDAKSGSTPGGRMQGGSVDDEGVGRAQPYLTPSEMMYQGSDDLDELLCLSTSTESETPFDEPISPRKRNQAAQSNSPEDNQDHTSFRTEVKTMSSEGLLSPSPMGEPEGISTENNQDEGAMPFETSASSKEGEAAIASPRGKCPPFKVTFRERTSPIPPQESETVSDDDEKRGDQGKNAGKENGLRSSSQEKKNTGNLDSPVVEDQAAQAIVDSLRSTQHDSASTPLLPPPPPPPPPLPLKSSSKRTKSSKSKCQPEERTEQDDSIADQLRPFVSHLDSKRAETVISPLSLPTMYDSDTYDGPIPQFRNSIPEGCTPTNVPSPCRSLPNRQEVVGVFCTNILDVIRTESYETHPIVSLRTPSMQTFDNSQEDDNSYLTSAVETWMESVAEHVEGTSPSSAVRPRSSRRLRDAKKEAKAARKEDPTTDWIWSLADRLDFAVDHINVALGTNDHTDAEDTESEDESLPVLSNMKGPSFSFSDGEDAVESGNPFRLFIANASRIKGASSSRRRQPGRKENSRKVSLREPIKLRRTGRGRSRKRENVFEPEKAEI